MTLLSAILYTGVFIEIDLFDLFVRFHYLSVFKLLIIGEGSCSMLSCFLKGERRTLINTAEDQVVLKEADDHLSTFLFCKKGKFIQLVPKNNPTFSFYISGKRG